MSKAPRQPTYDPNLIEVKAKFECEFRRFHVDRTQMKVFNDFYTLVKESHHLPSDMPFTVSYTDPRNRDLLPITNDENLERAFTTAMPLIRLVIYRKQELMLEDMNARLKKQKKGETKRASTIISAPSDFRIVSAIVDADMLPDTVRRVKLLKHSSDRPLGFYIRDGTSVRVTAYGLEKVPGIFISRLVPGGLAESTGLLAVNDEILEVNGIEVLGKSLDQVTDMMVANSQNLIITVKPASQPPATPRTAPQLAAKKGKQPLSSSLMQPKPVNSSKNDLPSVSASKTTPALNPQVQGHRRAPSDTSTSKKHDSWTESMDGTSNGPTKQKGTDDVINNKRHSVPGVLES